MARDKRQEDTAPGVPAWMTTFCDCMTLLLCFFVMLLSFSSFEPIRLRRLTGAFETMEYDSIFSGKVDPTDTMIEPMSIAQEHTKRGSEKPTDMPDKNVRKPAAGVEMLSADAFKDRRTLLLPSDDVFWGDGARIRPQATALLDKMVPYLDMVGGFTVIGESRSPRPGSASELSMRRSLALASYLADKAAMLPEKFSISGTDSGASGRFEGKPVVEITFLSMRPGK